MKLARGIATAIVTGLAWLLLVNGVSFIVSFPSPHGFAAFIYVGFFLSVLGAIIQPMHFFACSIGWARLTIRRSGAVGLVAGVGSFLIAANWQGASRLFPKDLFGMMVLAYVCLLGAAVAALLAWALLKLDASRKQRMQ